MTQDAGIVAFAFGVPATIVSNRRIAEIASRRAWAWNVPVYTQLDVRVEDWIHVGAEIEVVYTEEIPGEPPPTLCIARRAVWWANRRHLTRLWVVAAKPHLWRALRDLKEVIHEAGLNIEIRACADDIDKYPEDSWFCADSTQKRTTSRAVWEKRERALCSMPFDHYKRFVS